MRWPPATSCASSSSRSSTSTVPTCRSTLPWRTFPTTPSTGCRRTSPTRPGTCSSTSGSPNRTSSTISGTARTSRQTWPEEYWPAHDATATPEQFALTIEGFRSDCAALHELVADPATDLLTTIPNTPGHTILRGVRLVGDHNAYHRATLRWSQARHGDRCELRSGRIPVAHLAVVVVAPALDRATDDRAGVVAAGGDRGGTRSDDRQSAGHIGEAVLGGDAARAGDRVGSDRALSSARLRAQPDKRDVRAGTG